MPAPPLAIAEWIKGTPVTLKSGLGSNIFVVEFWATWCPPCRQTIPSLTGLQKKFKDRGVVFVGISDEETSVVKPFVQSMGANMDYTVAVDDRMQTWTNYMAAFGEMGIPHAFVVDKAGRIVWHGNPMGPLEQVLEQLLADRYDLDLARRTTRIQSLFQQYFMGAIAGQDTVELKKKGEELLAEADNFPGTLHQFAHVLLNEKRIVTRHPELAARAAKSAYDATGGTNPVASATYARALFETGKVQDALTVARKGLANAKDPNTRTVLESAIASYEKSAAGK
ncbi:MAG TPA: redoxin domain-containing protein [Methylomirabilota bacterium]|nr:redoxin domain-containing protein [Methylomirabilota bacterium]